MRAVSVAAAIFFTLAFTRQSVIGTQLIPCDGALVIYCATADVLGTGLAWTLWHAAFSIGIGLSFAALELSVRRDS